MTKKGDATLYWVAPVAGIEEGVEKKEKRGRYPLLGRPCGRN